MSMIDYLTPAHYKITRLGIQKEGSDVVASYDVAISIVTAGSWIRFTRRRC